MKKLTSFCLTLILILSFTLTLFAQSDASGVNDILSTLEELKKEYEKSIEDGDVERQNELIEMGNALLEKQIAESEASKGISTRNSYSSYFSSSSWIMRDVYSLSIYPINLAWSTSGIQSAWDILANRHRNDSNWYNESSLRTQFWCHANFAGNLKTPWNIEPSKSNTNPFTCN